PTVRVKAPAPSPLPCPSSETQTDVVFLHSGEPMRTPGSVPAATALLAALQILSLHPLPAQSPPARPKCDAPEYRQFDFWVGDWDVTAGGQRAGTNLVTLEEGGCLIHEHWAGAKGGTGQRLNFYDR